MLFATHRYLNRYQPRPPDYCHSQGRPPQPTQGCAIDQNQVCAVYHQRGCWILGVRETGYGAVEELQGASLL